ncbi:grainyhead-like protein 3 homolog isoform X2 [Amia ocellicauda]|uniref:grainyhead-like protein 3 homolog isoform X2 n=1 Tax=Amia ocellicauda TaxID=2972642 RepID=UPI0034640625
MTKEIDLRSVMGLQNDSLNCQRYSYHDDLDIWKTYPENQLPASNKNRVKPNSEEDNINFYYNQCNKATKEQKMFSSHRLNGMHEPIKRSINGTTPELINLENQAQIMKLLSENISAPQEITDINKKPQLTCLEQAPHCLVRQASHLEDFLMPPAEAYSIFDSILLPPQQKWVAENNFKEAAQEGLPCNDLFGQQTSPVYSETYANSPSERHRNDFQYMLGTPQASQHKSCEVPMAYLNKGQFYPIILKVTGADSSVGLSSSKVKTVVMAVFENEKNAETQLKCWNHWHSRQPTVKQRVIDIADYKEVFSGVSNVEEVAFNALSFIWNTNEEAKVYIGINCLSTDFSSQKGVKGLPLNLQIDTYDCGTGTNRLIHRAACQIKIFCDKGAERKMRDEERKQSKRKGKNAESSNNSSNSKQSVVSSSSSSDCTYFKTLEDLTTQPVLFIPEIHYSNMQRCGMVLPATVEEAERTSLKRSCPPYPDTYSPPVCKQPKREEQQRGKDNFGMNPDTLLERKSILQILLCILCCSHPDCFCLTVLLYVRTESEEVFDALMLNTPNLKGLKDAISEKYGLREEAIGKIYKKCKRGIFVNMDDNIIEHYTNHSAFLMEFTDVMGQFQVTLMEL